MGRFYESRTWVECPDCGRRFSPKKKRKKDVVTSGRWKLAYQGRGVLMVGRYGFRGWLGTWKDVIGGYPHIVPPYEVIGSAMMGIQAILRENGLWSQDVETGHWKRATQADVHARTALGKERLRDAGWPGDGDVSRT